MYVRGRTCRLALFLSAMMLLSSNTLAEDWPGFRGPTGMGICRESGLPVEWGGPDGKNVLWKAPLPVAQSEGKSDHNQSSPIVAMAIGCFVTTAFWSPARNRRAMCPSSMSPVIGRPMANRFGTRSFRLVRGIFRTSAAVMRRRRRQPTANLSRHCSALRGLAVLDREGRVVWQIEVPEWQAFDVAIASSPIIYRGQLVLLADRNNQKSTLTAYNLKTGEVLWEQKRPQEKFDHTTPVIVENQGKMQMLVAGSGELAALDPSSGERLWWCKTKGDVTSPVFTGGVVYTDSGRGGAGILVDATGMGDVTATHIKWKINQIPEGLSSPAVVGGRLYRAHNPGVVKCVDLESGKELYTTRLNGVSVASSPIVTPEGRIYFASAGKTFVLQDGPTFDLLATNDLGEPTLASAATSMGRLFFKGQRHLFCVAMLQTGEEKAAEKPAEKQGATETLKEVEKVADKKETENKATWTPISASVLEKVKPGYPGKTAGVTVDPATGDVYMVIPDQGLWQSSDHGETFARVDDKKIGGRCETGYALQIDPAGKRLVCFMIATVPAVGRTTAARLGPPPKPAISTSAPSTGAKRASVFWRCGTRPAAC